MKIRITAIRKASYAIVAAIATFAVIQEGHFNRTKQVFSFFS